MLYAREREGQRIRSYPGREGFCPNCKERLIAKCGPIKIWHWAHKARKDCDIWCEPESRWHIGWKDLVPAKWVEVARGQHRADIVTPSGCVVELQFSPISAEEIMKRERFYRRMYWSFYAGDFLERIDFRDRGKYWTFRWKQPRLSHTFISRRLFWDFDWKRTLGGYLPHYVFEVRKIYGENPCGGWGYFLRKDYLIEKVFGFSGIASGEIWKKIKSGEVKESE